MAEQFRQPSIPRPDLSQHSSWASVSRTHCDWLRAVGPQLGMDVSKLILGDVLSSSIGDDANSFGMYFMADIAQDVKASILERMDWEVSVPETPGEVKQKLKQVINLIQPLNFNDEVNYKKGRENWKEMKDWVEQQSRRRKDWRQALDYDMAMAETLSPYWQEFLYGRVEY